MDEIIYTHSIIGFKHDLRSLSILDAIVTWKNGVAYAGKEGTLTIKGAQRHWRIISGTGELVNLHGHGIFKLINPDIMLLSYEG